MEELIRLLDEYDNILSKNVPLIKSSTILYRGDQRNNDEIEQVGGFSPKKNQGEPLDYYNVIQHCIINGYGGPFISVTNDKDSAIEFAKGSSKTNKGFLYSIKDNINIVDFNSIITKLKECLNDIDLVIQNLQITNPNIESDLDFINKKTMYNQYKAYIYTAEKYHKAQKEELVPYKIELTDIVDCIDLNTI